MLQAIHIAGFRLLTEPASLKPLMMSRCRFPRGRFRLLTEPASLKRGLLRRERPADASFRLLTEPASLKPGRAEQRRGVGLAVSGSSQSRPH